MCIRDRAYLESVLNYEKQRRLLDALFEQGGEASASQITREEQLREHMEGFTPVSYTHLRAHETVLDLVCRLLLEKKKK